MYLTACSAQWLLPLYKASDTQAVGHGFEPRPPDDARTINYFYKMGLKILFRSDLYNCV